MTGKILQFRKLEHTPLHGPIDRRFDIQEQSISSKTLKERLGSTLVEIFGEAHSKSLKEVKRLLILEYESSKDSSFKAVVSVYEPDKRYNPRVSRTIGIYVYSDDLMSRDAVYSGVYDAVFGSTTPIGFVERNLPTFRRWYQNITDM